MDLHAALTGVLTQCDAEGPEGQAESDLQPLNTKLPLLLQLTEELADENPALRIMLALGIATFVGSKFALEGKTVLPAVFAGSFKRCGLLWKLLLKELETSSCPQRLLLKLFYCQGFCIQTFKCSPLDIKRSMVSENAACITFALDLSIAILQGCLPTEPKRLAATMISFFQQFDQYLPYDTSPIPPSCCQEVLTRLTVTSEPNEHENAIVLILTTVLHCVSHYGWHAAVGDIDLETLLMTTVHSHSEKLSITSKALLTFMPGTLGVEVLLSREQLSLIVKQLSTATISTNSTSSNEYSVQELLLIIKAITRVQDNCTGLLEEGVEEALGALMEQDDEIANAIAAEITCWIANASTEAVNMEEEVREGFSESNFDTIWGCDSLQGKDPDGAIALVDILLHQLAELILNNSLSDLSAEKFMTIETLLLTVFDIYWQSEVKVKYAVAELIGDKYIQCLNCLHEVLLNFRELPKDTDTYAAATSVGYNMLMQELARMSAYFCEKAGSGGLIGVHLLSLQSPSMFVATATTLNCSLTVLFYCAHLKIFHYLQFGVLSAIDILACVLQSPFAHIRLLTRLVICCLLPIIEDCHKILLKMTDEESQLLLTYIRDEVMLPGGLDPAKFLMATSVLYGDVYPQNVSGPLAVTLAEIVVQTIIKLHDGCVLESALCLLWTLCHTPYIVHRLSQLDHLIPELKTMQQTKCSAVSSLAKCVLWKLDCGNYEDNAECYQYACTCFHYGRYTECIEHCDHIMTTATSSLHGMVRQLRGKCIAHLHQKQFWNIIKQGSLDVAVPLKGGNTVDQCAISAKAAVKDLGFALDCGVLDEEGSYLMDIAMLHFVMIKHQLRDCNRCLLCRRRGVKLKDSHTCPKFVLKEVDKIAKESGIAEFIDAQDFYSASGRFAAYTAKTATYAMLCGRCEQVLSQNGEDQFQKTIMPIFNSANDEMQTAKYDSTLYSFCLGVVFRFFVHNVFTIYCNASEIYSLLVACRHHLLSLPVKYSETESPNPPPVATAVPTTPFEVFLFPSPLKLHIENSQLIPLASSMTGNYSAWYLTSPLCTEPETKAAFCHALVVRLLFFSIVIPFSPAKAGGLMLDENSRINPHGGDYQVLPDIRRWEVMPSGLLQVFMWFAHAFEKQLQQISSGLKTTKKDSKKANALFDSLTLFTNTLQQPIDANSLQLLPPKEKELISMFLSKSLVPVKMLPECFDIRTSPPEVILKEGYKLLYHVHCEEENATFFLAANDEDLPYGKLVVIIKYTEVGENFERVEGVNIHVRKDDSNCSVCVTGFLQEPATETLQETQHSRHRTVSEKIRRSLNALVQRCGSLKVFLRHANLQMRMKNNLCIDKRCSSSGCWYCGNRCHICMELANQGYNSAFPTEKLMFQHCSAECKAVVDKVSQFSTELYPSYPLKQMAKKHCVLASIMGCLPSVMSTRTVVQVNICIPMERSSISYGRPYATVQLHTEEQNVLFSVHLSDDLSPTQPVDDFPTDFSFQMLIESNLLKETFRMSLHPLQIFSISHLLRHATKADITLSKMFSISCSPCESKLCWEEIVASLNSTISQQVLFTRWMLEQVVLICEDKEEELQLSSSENLSQETTPLIPSCRSCCTLFWAYFQLTCLLWKRVLNGNGDLLFQKITYVTHITVKLYEQSPSHVQKQITDAFCSSAQILLLCGQIAITAIKGGLPLIIYESAVELLLLAHKFIAVVRTASEPIKSILARCLYQELELVKQGDVQKLTKVSGVAQQLLVTMMLKSHICGASEAVPIQTFLNSPFTVVSIMAKAVAVSLLQCCPQTEIVASDTEITHKEIDFLAKIVHNLTEDDMKRRYLFYLILQALTLLSSQPVNANQLTTHSIITELEALMECADEPEDLDIIANVLWKIANGGELESTTDKFEMISGEETPEIDICLDVEQGLCETAERLLMIIHEFCSMYLECEHVHESHSCTVSSASQLLCELHEIMDTKEKEEVAQFVSHDASILGVLSLAVSRHRKSWLRSFNGILTRGAIESLFVTWSDCSEDFCQAVAASGILKATANSLHWALEHETLNACDIVCLQNQVLMIYNVARQYPKQAAVELQLTCLQPLLNCSLRPLRVISKSIVAFLAVYIDTSDVATLCLTNDEVKFFADSFTGFINHGMACVSADRLKFSVEELLFCLQKLSSLPCDKNCCALPCLLDALLALSSYDDKTIATSALEVLWKIGMEPTVGLAILSHGNVVCTLQKMSVFNIALADLARNILWILGYGNAEDIIGCSEYAIVCYKFGKYTEATLWCDHILHVAPTMHPIVSRVKSCKGKALAQMYLQKQLQQLHRGDQMSMLGYDGNSEFAEAMILDNISSHPLAIDNEVLIQLCFADLQNWTSLCSQGQQAIELLGEVLDSGELDEQGSELLDWVMMDYCRESGKANDCKRCLLCRNIGELVQFVPKSTELDVESFTSESILSLHSFTHLERSQIVFMFCKECEKVLSMYSDEHVQPILDATSRTHGKPITYGAVFYLHLIAKLARKLPLAYTGYCSNWKDIYNTFVACRQILLSHDIYNDTINFPKVYLFNNHNSWYVFTNHSSEFCSFSSSRHVTAMVASKQLFGNTNQFQFLMMHTEGFTIVVEFCSEKEECVKLPSQYLINPAGGSYPIPHVSERWEAFPQELIQAFHNIALADERRNVCQNILRSEVSDLSIAQELASRSTRFWIPKKLFLSFLPEGFSLVIDSDAIRSISLPDGHKILVHGYDKDNNLTIFLAYATDSIGQKKQFYFIFTCKIHNYFIAFGMFLSGVATELTPSSNPIMFPLAASLPVVLGHNLLLQKFPPSLLLDYLRLMLVKLYGNFGFEEVSAYEDITRNANLAISLDTKCSPEGCWYCHHRCHSCMKPASVGHTWKDGDSGQLLYHCSNRCYRMYTGDIPESPKIDIKVGEIQDVPVHGTHLLLSATVLSMSSVGSTQVAISYGSKEVPEGVVYVFTQLKGVKNSFPPKAFFIQHDLTLVKYVWDCAMPQFNMFTTIMETLREVDFVKTNLQPVFNTFGCNDLTGFLEQKFPHLRVSFMDQSGVIYSWPPTSGQNGADSLMGKGGDGDSTPNGNT